MPTYNRNKSYKGEILGTISVFNRETLSTLSKERLLGEVTVEVSSEGCIRTNKEGEHSQQSVLYLQRFQGRVKHYRFKTGAAEEQRQEDHKMKVESLIHNT